MDLAELRGPVASLFGGSSRVKVVDAREEPIDYDPFGPGRSVSRLTGIASVDGRRRKWSMIRKVTAKPGVASAYLYDNGRRELMAYLSGILAGLPEGFSAPAAHRLVEHDDGSFELLLEEVHDDPPGPWREADFVTAARHLGRFSGAGLATTDHVQDWMFTGWRERHGQPDRVPDTLAWMRTLARDPTVTRRLGTRVVDRSVALVADQARIRDLLGRLPQTLCHHDAQRSNLYLRSWTGRSETVAIDWESVGPGTVGADLASLLFSSVRRGDMGFASLRRIADDALEAYGLGLRDAGWSSSPDLVRLGFGAAVTLRWSLVRDVLAAITTPGERVFRGRAMHESPEQSLDELIGLAGILLDVADESAEIARDLAIET